MIRRVLRAVALLAIAGGVRAAERRHRAEGAVLFSPRGRLHRSYRAGAARGEEKLLILRNSPTLARAYMENFRAHREHSETHRHPPKAARRAAPRRHALHRQDRQALSLRRLPALNRTANRPNGVWK